MTAYITTPIFYVNGPPHIGHAHSAIMADILKRNRKILGNSAFLTTGCDEHGQKNQEAAELAGLPYEEYLDFRYNEFRRLFDKCLIDYDFFVRTSNSDHKEVVKNLLLSVYNKGYIKKKSYQGKYCTGCEQFKKDSDLNDHGMCPDHSNIKIQYLDEENYFLNLEICRIKLIDVVQSRKLKIQPEIYRSELLDMLSEPLEDLCVSRPKSRVSAGIEVPFDNNYVVYVWFDALISYLSSIDYPNNSYQNYWVDSTHVIGKDILKTHGVYWPIMLMLSDIALPKRLSVHAHLLGEGGVKMSKTIGNVVDPFEIIEGCGAEALRLFLSKNMRCDSDSMITYEQVFHCYNTNLSNKLGNLLTRSLKFLDQKLERDISTVSDFTKEDIEVRENTLTLANRYAKIIELQDIPSIITHTFKVVDVLNGYFDQQKPWILIRDPIMLERVRCIVYVTIDCVRLIFECLQIILPNSSRKALFMLGIPIETITNWVPMLDGFTANEITQDIEILYPRL